MLWNSNWFFAMQIHLWSEIWLVLLSFSWSFFHFLRQRNNVSTACYIIAFVLETFKLMVTLSDVIFHESFCSFFLKVNFFLFFVTWYLIAKVLKLICSRSLYLYLQLEKWFSNSKVLFLNYTKSFVCFPFENFNMYNSANKKLNWLYTVSK